MGSKKEKRSISIDQAKEALIGYFTRNKRMPSYAEGMLLFGVASKDSSFRIIQKLIDLGIVTKDAAGKLIPGSFKSGIKVLGLVEAGFATPAEENLLDTITLDDYLIDRREASFMLRVKGDSMKDAGICEGDFVIVERTQEAKPGQIVIASIDGGWTMKYFRRKGSIVYLEPANAKYKTIYPKEDFAIAAVVKAVVRKY